VTASSKLFELVEMISMTLATDIRTSLDGEGDSIPVAGGPVAR
jgi:hypothetical protein